MTWNRSVTVVNKIIIYKLCIIILIFINRLSFTQTDSLDIYDFDFDQLSKLQITSASKAPQNIGEVPSTIFVIRAAEIKEKGYFTLEEALSDLSGFQFRNMVGLNSYVFQRGIPSQNNLILVLIDGIQVNELNSGGFYGGGQYNLSNVDRIEIIYGPASVAYGTNAISGIINIVTNSEKENQFNINTLVGTFNTINTDFSCGYFNEKKNLGIWASGMYKQSDKADLKGKAGDNNWTDLLENYENDYSFDLKIQANDFIFGTNYLHKQSSAATYSKSVSTIYLDHGTYWNIRFINNYIKYNKEFSEQFTLSSTLYNRNATVLNNSVLFITDTAQIGYYRPNNLTGFENIVSYNATHFLSFIGGLILEYEQLAKKYSKTFSNSPDLRPPTPEKPAMEKNYLMSIFIESRITPLKNLYLSGGFRFDQSSIYDQVLTPRAGIVYDFYNQKIRFSYAEAFRAPKPWDYNDGIGNNSLLPEKMKSLEAAITFSLFDNYKLDLIGYRNKLDNAINKEVINDSYRWINKGEVNTEGIEVYLRYSSKKIKSSVNYTFNQSYDENNDFIPEISKHSGNVSATYIINDHIKVNIRANYVGKRENPQIITSNSSKYVDPYLVFHGTLSVLNYKNYNFQLIVKNIFNKEYYHTSNRPPERYRQPQRTVMLSIGYIINNKR